MGNMLALSVIAPQCQLSQRESLWQKGAVFLLFLALPLGELARMRLRGRSLWPKKIPLANKFLSQ